MTGLTSVGQLYTANGAPCHYVVVQGFLRNNVPLELFCASEIWKPLIRVRVVIISATETDVVLTTSDQIPYQARPDDLIRVRIVKAGETP